MPLVVKNFEARVYNDLILELIYLTLLNKSSILYEKCRRDLRKMENKNKYE